MIVDEKMAGAAILCGEPLIGYSPNRYPAMAAGKRSHGCCDRRSNGRCGTKSWLVAS